jgi:hypothetical protein
MALPRKKLKEKFRNGARPSQKDFNDLIDSDINSEDDGIEFFEDGIKLSRPAPDNKTDKKNDADYQIQFGDASRNTLGFYHESDISGPYLSIAPAGILTKGITAQGEVSMRARRGNFTQKDVLGQPPRPPHVSSPVTADNNWHTILYTSKICQAYEVVAQLDGDCQAMVVALVSTSQSPVTDKNTDKQSLVSRIVDSVANFVKRLLNISNTKIKITQSYSDWLSDKVRMKWVENYNSYSLQVKANSGHIYYSITQLWGPDFTTGS